MKQRITLNDIFPEWVTGKGIFSFLDTYEFPWKSAGISNSLDIMYHGSFSGNKIIAPIFEMGVDENNTVSDDYKTKVAEAVYNLFGKNWTKLYATLDLDYNPIENYAMIETSNENNTANSNSGIYGFNSATAVNANTATGTGTTERELKRNGNIGVTTSQEMIEAERDLWYWNFYKYVFSDLDTILVLNIY